jgi:arylsulfatase A-like enzyme
MERHPVQKPFTKSYLIVAIFALAVLSWADQASAQNRTQGELFKPSIYYHGIQGLKTPKVDRMVKEGAIFTDWYSRQSCTSGHAAFITGQYPIHQGLTKLGPPGED